MINQITIRKPIGRKGYRVLIEQIRAEYPTMILSRERVWEEFEARATEQGVNFKRKSFDRIYTEVITTVKAGGSR